MRLIAVFLTCLASVMVMVSAIRTLAQWQLHWRNERMAVLSEGSRDLDDLYLSDLPAFADSYNDPLWWEVQNVLANQYGLLGGLTRARAPGAGAGSNATRSPFAPKPSVGAEIAATASFALVLLAAWVVGRRVGVRGTCLLVRTPRPDRHAPRPGATRVGLVRTGLVQVGVLPLVAVLLTYDFGAIEGHLNTYTAGTLAALGTLSVLAALTFVWSAVRGGMRVRRATRLCPDMQGSCPNCGYRILRPACPECGWGLGTGVGGGRVLAMAALLVVATSVVGSAAIAGGQRAIRTRRLPVMLRAFLPQERADEPLLVTSPIAKAAYRLETGQAEVLLIPEPAGQPVRRVWVYARSPGSNEWLAAGNAAAMTQQPMLLLSGSGPSVVPERHAGFLLLRFSSEVTSFDRLTLPEASELLESADAP